MNETEKYVDDCYLIVLGRPADADGLKNYVEQIEKGDMKREDVLKALHTSDEYHERIEFVRDNNDICSHIKDVYLKTLHRAVDVGGLSHYTQEIGGGNIAKEDLERILKSSDEYKTRFRDIGNIVFCQGICEDRIEETKKCITRVQPGNYVDRAVIIADESVTDESRNWLEDHGCDVYVEQWEDNTVKMRNQYLSKLKYGDWVAVSDPDELYSSTICQDLRQNIEDAHSSGYGLLLLASHDNMKMIDGSVNTSVSGFCKNLIFRFLPDVYYVGAGETGNVHEVLNLPEGTTVLTLPDRYFYTHYKMEVEAL